MTGQKIVQVKKLKIKIAIIGIDEFECTFILVCSNILSAGQDFEVIVYKTSSPIDAVGFKIVSGILPAFDSPADGAEINYQYSDTYALVEKNHLVTPGSKPMKFVRWLSLKEIIDFAQQKINEDTPFHPDRPSNK